MAETLPPRTTTTRTAERLRTAFLAAALVGLLASPLAARVSPVRVLIYAPVSEAARPLMSTTLWAKQVADYVNARTLPWTGTDAPTVADCRSASADFMVSAPFELRPRLPGMPNANGRQAAVTHLVFTNCVTGKVVYDQHVDFESDPYNQPEGDLEPVPEISWSKSVPAALAKYPVYFPRVSRVVQVTPPLGLVDLRNEVKAGDVLVIYASADRTPKGPIDLVVTQLNGHYAEVMFSTTSGGAQPKVGDYVEPAPRVSPSPSPTPSPRPTKRP
ncbi:MAG TPA: hypothetical protein VKG44_05000 [Candidatus Baltobacteraceae bacterium]|nr:hypothetical protein [Candidatus Baltobacteraceae bacterium]